MRKSGKPDLRERRAGIQGDTTARRRQVLARNIALRGFRALGPGFRSARASALAALRRDTRVVGVRHAARPRLLCIATILMYPMMLDACRQGWPPEEEQTDVLDALDAPLLLVRRARHRVRGIRGGATSGSAGG